MREYIKLYNQIKKDYEYIRENYGEVYEYCECCMSDKLQLLLNNPTKEMAFNIFVIIINRYFSYGFDSFSNLEKLPIEDDEKLTEILKRWEVFFKQL